MKDDKKTNGFDNSIKGKQEWPPKKVTVKQSKHKLFGIPLVEVTTYSPLLTKEQLEAKLDKEYKPFIKE